MKQALIIFARPPELGKVKTRLAAAVGPEKALAVYIKLLEHTRAVAKQHPCDKWVFLTESSSDPFWKIFYTSQQAKGDLGAKMQDAFAMLFEFGYQQVVIIGSDCPALAVGHLHAAFDALHSADAVVGPAADGGYYLLGMNQLHPELFQEKSWSTDAVLRQTAETLVSLNLYTVYLETLHDVDEAADVPQEWKQQLEIGDK